jgi:4-cresol dehydrogenase (hydroxylating)
VATTQILPKGVSAREFARALVEFGRIVGEDFVIRSEEQLLPYRKAMLPEQPEPLLCSAVVIPANVEEIQGILKVCNRHRISIWPISTGRNFGYGSAAPATPGQVVLELRRLNRILEVDAELGTALVEPGVTYQQLQDHLKERNIPLWLDFPAPGPLVGPVGNTLERGGGQTPYGDHFGHCCGMEVVLADGAILRTGLGGVENSNSWQCYRYGYGPYLDGIFTQSNFGIVTKLGLWLMPAPPAHRTFLVQYPEDADLAKAVDVIRPLRLDRTIGNFGVLFNAALALTSFVRKADLHNGPGAVPDERIFAAARERGITPWMYSFSLYGRPEIVEVNSRVVTAAFEQSGAVVIPDIHDPMQVNELSLETFRLLNWTEGGGLAWFAPVCPNRGADMRNQHLLAKSIMSDHGLDFMTGATCIGREIENVMPLVFNPASAEESQRADACMRRLIREFTAAGYGIYRTGTNYMDLVASLHGATNLEVNRRLKRALDPNGILAPGKSGIQI